MFGSGLGHQLMVSVDEWVGGAQTTLEVATYNERAIRFYQKHGFVEVKGTEYLYRDKIPVFKMKRKGDEG
jgi:ribosomal protein S18 acetylase RimI-like enzyme